MTTSRFRLQAVAVPCTTLFFLAMVASTWAEIRPSVIARHSSPAAEQTGDYNLKFREVRFQLTGSMGAEFTDNLNLSHDNPQSDIGLHAGIGLGLIWPVTRFNSLRLNTSLGYTKYLKSSDRNDSGFNIAPDSEIAFDMFVGNFVINFHDRFSVETDPIGDPTVSNSSNYRRFTNTAGVSVFWAVNSRLDLTLSYDHTDTLSNGDFSFSDYSQDQISLATSTPFGRRLTGGIEGGIGQTRYRESNGGNTVPSHVGLYLAAALSDYTTLRVAAGYQSTPFADSPNNNDDFSSSVEEARQRRFFNQNGQNSDSSSLYWNLQLTNRTTARLSQTFTAGNETQLGVTTQQVELLYGRYGAVWRANSAFTFNGSAFFESGQENGGTDSGDFRRIGVSVGTSYRLSRKASVSVNYQFVTKHSDFDLDSYNQNRVTVDLSYDF